MTNPAKLKMLELRIGQRRDATRALTQVPTGWGSFGCPTSHTVGQKAVNPRDMGTASPYQKGSLPDSKKNSKKTLTKGGESSSGNRYNDISILQGVSRPTGASAADQGVRPTKQVRLPVAEKSMWHWALVPAASPLMGTLFVQHLGDRPECPRAAKCAAWDTDRKSTRLNSSH